MTCHRPRGRAIADQANASGVSERGGEKRFDGRAHASDMMR